MASKFTGEFVCKGPDKTEIEDDSRSGVSEANPRMHSTMAHMSKDSLRTKQNSANCLFDFEQKELPEKPPIVERNGKAKETKTNRKRRIYKKRQPHAGGHQSINVPDDLSVVNLNTDHPASGHGKRSEKSLKYKKGDTAQIPTKGAGKSCTINQGQVQVQSSQLNSNKKSARLPKNLPTPKNQGKQRRDSIPHSSSSSTQNLRVESNKNPPQLGAPSGVKGKNTYSDVLKQNPAQKFSEKRKTTKKRNTQNQTRAKKVPEKDEIKLKEFYELLNLHTLRNLNKRKPDEIVKTLISVDWFKDFQTCIMKERVIQADLFQVLLEILTRISKSVWRDDINQIYSQLLDSLFLLKHVPYHMAYMATTSPQNGVQVFSNVIEVLTVLVQKFPGCYEVLPINVLKRVQEKLQFSTAEMDEKCLNELNQLVESEFNQLVEIYEELSKPKLRDAQSTNGAVKIFKKPDEGPPPNDFRSIPMLPSPQDIFRDDNPYLRKNVIKGPYTNLEHYLDVHFRLLYEDFQAPLREGVNMLVARVEARKKEPEKMRQKGIGRIDDVYVYEGVRIMNPKCEREGLMFRLTFDVSKLSRFTDWRTTKRFTYGSLLCLSKDNFQTFFFATVANKDENDLRKGMLDIKILLCPHAKVSLGAEDVYLMAESRAYFEACRHVLTRLQFIEELPFQQYLVQCTPDVDAPAYLRLHDIQYDFSSISTGKSGCKAHVAPVLNPEQWPSAASLELNDSQFKALETALTNELALIQGPPGTGKTYVGLKIAKLLLANKKKTDLGPILVVCYTNHALDQFLEGIFQFQERGIVRIGGRSSSDVMNECSIRNFVYQWKKKERCFLNRDELNKTKGELQTVVEKIREVNEKLLQETIIREVVKKDLIESLVCDRDGYIPSFNEALLRWLNLFSDDAEINEEEVTVLLQSDDGEVFTKQSSRVESVQLTERDFWVMAIVRTTTGGGILARSLKKPRISQTWFIDDEGYLAFEEARENKIRFSLRGTIKINDNQWHEVVMAYEEQEKKISLFVDKKLETEKDGCSFHEYNMEKERVFVGSNPFPDRPEQNEIEIKKLDYIPNVIPIFNESSEQELQEPDLPEVQLLSEADFIEEQRMIEGDYDVEGFEPQLEPKPTMLDKILAQGKDSGGGWSVVKNKKNELFKFQHKVKRELAKEDFISIEDSEKVKDVWELKPQDRWKLYRGWTIAAKKEYDWEMATKQVEYEDAIEACRDAESEQDSKLLIKHASVIGMTTTGAAKRPKLLKGIGARVVIVEEAAEVLESHIVTSLTRECQHLILIGDHQQLRPTPNVYDLVTNFNFDVSLFERMINNGLDFVCLKKQHRMRPEISQVCRHIYPDLEDHESVFRFDNIAGVKHNIYFVCHEYMEVTEEDTASHVNRHEAKFLVALCKYLLQQGYKASQITILTPYTGQMREIQKCTKNVLPRPRHGEKSVRVTSIDNYQGEENDIILLSLVRSNKRENIGFLNIENRVCVALSRAKKGLYCIGNMNMIRRRSKLWKNIVKDMEGQGLVGPKLTLCCQMHGDDERINVETPDDFQRAPNGGCTRICRKELSCGHICNKMCHPVDQEHVDLHKCRAPCETVPCSLHPNRRCTKRCSDKCSPCREVVQKILPMCEHEQDMFCHEDPSNGTCKAKCPEWLECGHQCQNLCSVPCGPCEVLVKKPLPDCYHQVEMPCYEDPQEFVCELQCSKELSCGHQCAKKCHLPSGKCKCMEKVTKLLPNCNHQMELACYIDPKTVRCNLPCTKILDCGHPCTELCGYECNAFCNYQCSKEFDCGHQCPDLCSAPCPPCEVQIQVTLPKCGHMTTTQCCQSLDKVRCSQPCQLSLDCGHACTGYCSQKCIPCRRSVRRTIPGCGHKMKALCSTPQENILCPVPCEKILPECGHQCQKMCHLECTPCMKIVRKTLPRCYHRVNAPCSTAASEVSCPLPCTAMLPCGHQCTKTCSEVCNPCQQVVSKEIPRCKHNQNMACSTPPEEVYCHSPCPKKLSCGHFCSRKCSDSRCGPCVSSEMVAKVLPCGHENKVPCKQDPSTFACTKQRLMPLPCGHDKPVPCISKFKKFSCYRMCRSRGNMNCGPACGKCLVKWLKPLPCGHKVHVVCYKYKDATECLSCSGLFMKN